MSAVLAPATITPPRLLYIILPEPDAAGNVGGHRAPVEDGAWEGMVLAQVLKTKPQAPPRALSEMTSPEPQPLSISVAPPSLKETETARPGLGEAPPAPEFVPRALGVTAAPETVKPATGSAAGGGPAVNALEGQGEPGRALGRGALHGAPMGSPRGADEGPVDNGVTGGGRGVEVRAALPPGSPMSLAIPRYNDNPKPVYPWRARLRGEQGIVLLLVRVSGVGRASDVRISQFSGSEALDEAALSAVRQWIFHPARRGDQPVDMWVQVPIHFRLEGR